MMTNEFPFDVTQAAVAVQAVCHRLNPTEIAAWVSLSLLVMGTIGRSYHAIVNGGGLKAILSALWSGTNTPSKPTGTPNTPMNTPKIMLVILFAVLAAAFGLTVSGCKTTTTVTNGQTNTVVTLNPVAAAGIKAGLALGIPFAVRADSNSAPYLALVGNVFSAAAESGKYDPATIQDSLNNISAKELRDPLAQQLVLSAFAAYKGSLADAVNAGLDKQQYGLFAKQLLQAVSDGILIGLVTAPLGASAPVYPYGSPEAILL